MANQEIQKIHVQQNVDTQVLTLSFINEHNYMFSIPSYQRPYVWPDEDVLKLINDINNARIAKDDNYFIGTVLTSKQTDNGINVYELIDGQQRTTTLMLIALAFKKVGVLSPLADVSTFDKQPRLQFSIRDQVQQLLGSLAGLEDYVFPGDVAISDNPYLTRVYAALTVLQQWVVALSVEDRMSLAGYIFERVQWVNNTVSADMDLSRLFSTMNTTGIQLEQADILKSKLLKQVKTDKPLFDAIWVACEHMDNYFERNLRKVFPAAPWNDIKPEDLSDFDKFPEVLLTSEKAKASGLTIAELAKTPDTTARNENKADDTIEAYDLDKKTVYCRSIIGFPLLLIHAYRIFLALHPDKQDDIGLRVHKDKLLKTFEPLTKTSESEVKRFIKTLWQVRYQFDRWIVKWVERDDSDEEQLLLTKISRSQSGGKSWYINRAQSDLSPLSMLQCVRNFTGERSAQYWLTPFIAGLIEADITDDKRAEKLLERVDNELSLTTETQKEASFKQALQKSVQVEGWTSKKLYLEQSEGTSFEHYWFQKLEYLLWKKMKQEDAVEKEFKKYRITSKNSVEHVHAQKEEHKKPLDKSLLDSFGNLVLLSPGENSSYSNQAVKKKMVDFAAKSQYDSLKLKAIFDLSNKGENWGESEIRQHQKEMLGILSNHYAEANEA